MWLGLGNKKTFLGSRGPVKVSYTQLSTTLQDDDQERRNSVSAVEHAQRQQLVARFPPLLSHDEQSQSDGREAEVDGNLGICPCNLVPPELDGEKCEDQEGGKQERPKKVYLTQFLARWCRNGWRPSRIWMVFGLGIR